MALVVTNGKVISRWMLLFILIFTTQTISNAKELTFLNAASSVGGPIGKFTWHFYDQTGTLNIDQVEAISFKKSKQEVLSHGYNTGADWVKFCIINPQSEPVNKVLRINKPLIDTLELFTMSGRHENHQVTGFLVPKYERGKEAKSNYFELTIDARDTVWCFLKVTSTHSKQLAIYLDSPEGFLKYEQRLNLFLGFYLGGLIIITLYNLFLGVSIKDKMYVLYALSNIGGLMATLALKGFLTSNGALIPAYLNYYLVPFFITSFTFFSPFFCIQIINIKKHSKWLYSSFRAVILLSLGAAIFPIVLNKLGIRVTFQPLAIMTFVFTIVATISGIVAIGKGERSALYYLIGWTVGLVGVLLYVLLLLGYLPVNIFTENLYMLGSVLEVLILSFVLVDRHNKILLERNQLKESLDHKTNDLAIVITDNKQRLLFKEVMLDELNKVIHANDDKIRSKLNSVRMALTSQISREKKNGIIQGKIDKINNEFESRIKRDFAQLSAKELELCGFIKLGMSIKEIAELRNVSEGAVKTARHRIKSKMKLSETPLDQFIQENY